MGSGLNSMRSCLEVEMLLEVFNSGRISVVTSSVREFIFLNRSSMLVESVVSIF